MHVCHAGLVDIAVPILYEDMIIGYILFGQLKADTNFTAFENYIVDLGLDIEEMKSYYTGISFYDSGKIIHENLENDLSIHTISQSIHVSKSVLYKKFHACFHCTVSESKRVEKSIEWLTKTDLKAL